MRINLHGYCCNSEWRNILHRNGIFFLCDLNAKLLAAQFWYSSFQGSFLLPI